VIEARALELRTAKRVLLGDMSFQVNAGEFVAVMGPNGIGKTTLLRSLAGLRNVAAGTIRINGADVTALDAAERARRIAYMPSEDLLTEAMRVKDVVAMGRFAHHRWWQWNSTPEDDRAMHAALDAVHLSEYRDRWFATLSSGERQRVWLAVALAQEAPVLLLDEPTSHLDVRVAQAILQLLREAVVAGKTVVCALHDLNEAAEFADRVMLLGDGGIAAFGRADRVLTSQTLDKVYGIAMESVRTTGGALRVFARHH